MFELPGEPKRDFQPVLEPKLDSQSVAQSRRESQQVVKSHGGFQPFALDSKYFPSGWMGYVTGVKGTGTLTVDKW